MSWKETNSPPDSDEPRSEFAIGREKDRGTNARNAVGSYLYVLRVTSICMYICDRNICTEMSRGTINVSEVIAFHRKSEGFREIHEKWKQKIADRIVSRVTCRVSKYDIFIISFGFFLNIINERVQV